MSRNPARAIDALVGDFYEAALDDSRWRGLSARMAQTLDAESCVLKMVCADGQVELTDVTDNLVVSPSKAAWAEHWHRNDLWVERSLTVGKSRIVTSDELVPQAVFDRSAFYRDWTRHLGIYHMIGAVLDTGDGATGVVGIHRPHDARSFGPRDRRTLATLLPHMQRALRLRSVRSDMQGASPALEAILTHCGRSALVVDGDRRIHFVGGAAAELFGPEGALCVKGGRLVARDPRVEGQLVQVVRASVAIAEGRAIAPPASAVVVPIPRGVPWVLWAYPLPESAGSGVPGRCRVLLLANERDHSDSSMGRARSVMARTFGLTPREADVACAVGAGDSVERICARLSMSPGHVRQRLKSIYAKTGTTQQSQLCALVHRMH